MKQRLLGLAVLIATSILAGCGGGSAFAPLAAGAVAPEPPAPTPTPTKAPIPTPTPSPTPTPTPGALIVAPSFIAIGATNPTSTLVNASETNYAGPITESNNCSGVASVTLIQSAYSRGPNGSQYASQYSVSQIASGTCSIAFGDNHGGTVNVPVTSTSFGPLTASTNAVSIGNGAPITATAAITEANYPLAFAKTDTCAGIATATLSPGVGPAATLSISQVAAGTCSVTVKDNHGGTTAVSVTSTTSTVIIQTKGRRP